jgi:hypothetical protein
MPTNAVLMTLPMNESWPDHFGESAFEWALITFSSV